MITRETVVSCFAYAPIEQPLVAVDDVRKFLEAKHVLGTVSIAAEGVNLALASLYEAALTASVQHIQESLGLGDLKATYSNGSSDRPAFKHLKVELVEDLIGFDVNVHQIGSVGTEIEPSRWDAILDDPSVPVIDVRNTYETDIGNFEGAQFVVTSNFKQFKEFADSKLATESSPSIAMYCTGGIRCEPAAAYLLEQGFSSVYKLQGGILAYLEQIPAKDSKWTGDCFVFDGRIALDANLDPAGYALCHACKHPLTQSEFESMETHPNYACQYCVESVSVNRGRTNPRTLETGRFESRTV